ncbi:hypothetical protein AXF42_Ash015492 [Apostasia shenzhenica]|uniref:DUF4378 domain-containing protein n=1 Tax=Apostasia shenzhenica TaxID=1088818 RepID=A0A2H9ZSD2_9ASPA|nr:hypothetical protein AXF42_Ash015492 [Apostasia shenzhenica]
MAGNSNIYSVSMANSPRHWMTPNWHHDGFEAPGLELSLETVKRNHVSNENFTVRQLPKSSFNQGSAPTKMSTNNEAPYRGNSHLVEPSVVARLMGIDSFPPEIRSPTCAKKYVDEDPGKYTSKVSRFTTSKTKLNPIRFTNFKPAKEELPLHANMLYSCSSFESHLKNKLRYTEHPQEGILQNFRRELQAWQNSQSTDCSRKLDYNGNTPGVKNNNHIFLVPKESVNAKTKSFEASSMEKFRDKRIKSCSPKRIVILKPCFKMNDETKEPCVDSCEMFGKHRSIEDFLEEVKERLRLEVEGMGRNDFVRDTIDKNLVETLSRSESSRSYKSDFHLNEQVYYVEMEKHVLNSGKDEKTEASDSEAASSRKLLKSFSSSSFRTSLDKPLSEHQICRKHEGSDNDSPIASKTKKDGLNLKGKVLNLRRNFSLGGKFFRKMTKRNLETMPSISRNFEMVQENSTEVPPTPASFCSSPVHENHSPVSPLDIPLIDDHSSTQVSGELSMNLEEYIESKVVEKMETEAQLCESSATIHVEDHAEAYVRDILVVSGLCDGSPTDQAISMLHRDRKPICTRVFYEVENRRKFSKHVDDDDSAVTLGDVKFSRKMLFDLVNEALPVVLRAPLSRLTAKGTTRGLARWCHAEELLEKLLHQVQIFANQMVVNRAKSVDTVLASDVNLMPWETAANEGTSSSVMEVEWLILGELIDELVSDFFV